MDFPSDAKPQPESGLRNFDCPYYLFCLDLAAANLWNSFSCLACGYRNAKQSVSIDEIDLGAPGWEDVWDNN